MQAIPTAVALCAILSAAGAAGSAMAQSASTPAQAAVHTMTVRTPDGSLEKILYTGSQPPRVDFQAADSGARFATPVFDDVAVQSPFAELDRLSAMMDRQAAAMMQETYGIDRALFADPQGASSQGIDPQAMLRADFGRLPPGTQGYTVISTMSGNNVCTHSVRYSSNGDGKAPRVLTSTSGDCGASAGAAPKALHAVQPRPMTVPQRSNVISAAYHKEAAKPAARFVPSSGVDTVSY